MARIAVGSKVFKSKCALRFQFGTKNPYVLFVLYTERTKREIKVFLNEEDLKEMAYYVAKDENDESEEYDDTLSIISFRVKPTEANNLDQFADWYDGIDEDGSESKYITVELRDKDQFSVSRKTKYSQLSQEYSPLTRFCTHQDHADRHV